MEVDEILKQRSWSKSEEKRILELCSTIVSLQTELATIYDGVWDHLQKLHDAVAADDRKLLMEQCSASAKGICRTESIKQAIYDTKIQLDYYCDPSHPLDSAVTPKFQRNGILKEVVPIKEVTIVEPKKKEKEKKEKLKEQKEMKKKEISSSPESSPKERKGSSGRKSDASSDGSNLPRKMSTSKEEKKRIEKEIKEKEKAEKEAIKAKKKADKEKEKSDKEKEKLDKVAKDKEEKAEKEAREKAEKELKQERRKTKP